MPTETFRSKVDTWLLLVLISAAAVALVASVISINADSRAWPAALLLMVVGVVLPLWILTSTRYTLNNETLAIRCGPFHWQVPLAGISAMTPTRNPLSSPALSLDRLQIQYQGGKVIMISPPDQDAFIRSVRART